VIYIYLDRIDRRLKRRLEPNLDEADGIERPHVIAAE
jgi:HAE1 family hydrophobic/amphiphilic exporter-1